MGAVLQQEKLTKRHAKYYRIRAEQEKGTEHNVFRYVLISESQNLPKKKGRFLFMESTQGTRLDIQRAYNRKYAANYRRNSPEKKRANDLRYYVRQLIAAGYTVTAPAATSRAAV